MPNKNKKSGFTMIELMVIITGIGILLAVTVSYVNPLKRIGESRDARRSSDVESLAQALELYATDNSQIPSDFSTPILAIDEKYVLCNSASSLTCDGDTHACVVVDDADFLVYIDSLPVDPSKSSAADTGYYVMRKENQGKIVVGACNPYGSDAIQVVARSAFSVGCGNGVLEASLGEVCDSDFTDVCEATGYYTGNMDAGNGDCKYMAYCSPDCSDCDVGCE